MNPIVMIIGVFFLMILCLLVGYAAGRDSLYRQSKKLHDKARYSFGWDIGNKEGSTSVAICPGCKNVIEPNLCQCGKPREAHPIDQHDFIELGCSCHNE